MEYNVNHAVPILQTAMYALWFCKKCCVRYAVIKIGCVITRPVYRAILLVDLILALLVCQPRASVLNALHPQAQTIHHILSIHQTDANCVRTNCLIALLALDPPVCPANWGIILTMMEMFASNQTV